MQNLLSIASLLFESPDRLFTQDDLADIAPDTRDELLASRLLVSAPPARSVVCDVCQTDHVEEVTRTRTQGGHNVYRIPCPEAGWVVVPKTRLQQWRVDVARLVAFLAKAVQTDPTPTTLGNGGAWRLGEVDIAGAVYGVAIARTDSVASIAEAMPPSRTIVLLPTRPTGVDTEFAVALALPDAIDSADGRFTLKVNRIRAALGIDLVERNVFRQQPDKLWELSFAGETTRVNHLAGFTYIARLLTEPERNIPAATLLAARTGIDARVMSGSSGEHLDEQARREFQRRYDDLEEEIQMAESNNDSVKAENLRAEREQLAAEVKRATGLGGRRRQSSDAEKARKSVSTAVSRAIDKIEKTHKLLADHLVASISMGTFCQYTPSSQTDWET